MLQPAFALALALGLVLGVAALFNGLPDAPGGDGPVGRCLDACASPATDESSPGTADRTILSPAPARADGASGRDDDDDKHGDEDEKEERHDKRKKGKGRDRDD